jgi:4-amino-4-deoxy-L-arabinose transferase-like glycosyltransferase
MNAPSAFERNSNWLDVVGIAFLASLFYFPFLGGVHLFDWDEINFAEMAREMILLQDYLHLHINFEAFYEKPPFFIWLQALSMHLWGMGDYAARFPNAVCGVITHLLIYFIGKKEYSRRVGLLWTGIFMGSILPHWYFKSGIIDPWFNLFIFLGIYALKKCQDIAVAKEYNHLSKAIYTILWAGFFTGLAVLTKGPAAILITGLMLFFYSILTKFRNFLPWYFFVLYGLSILATVFLWLGIEIYSNGTAFVKEFLIRNYELFIRPDAGHKGFVGYHFVVILLGVFPASLLGIRAFYGWKKIESTPNSMRIWMLVLFWVVLILFSIVKTKIIHYSSLCYLPLTFLSALVANAMMDQKIKLSMPLKTAIMAVVFLLSLVLIATPWLGKNTHLIIPYINDVFAKENLKAQVNWIGIESLVGIFLFLTAWWGIRKIQQQDYIKGFVFLFAGVAITVQLIMYLYLGNIEGYSQRSAINFFKSISGKDAYVLNLGYKSYAQLYYFQKPVPQQKDELNEDWLLHQKHNKPLYIITKINKLEEVKSSFSDLQELYRENGFVFLIKPSK